MIHVDKVQAMAPVFTSTFILLISRSELTVAPDTSYHLWESSCTNNDISNTDTVDLHPNKIEKDELPVDWEDLWSGTRKLLHDICKICLRFAAGSWDWSGPEYWFMVIWCLGLGSLGRVKVAAGWWWSPAVVEGRQQHNSSTVTTPPRHSQGEISRLPVTSTYISQLFPSQTDSDWTEALVRI